MHRFCPADPSFWNSKRVLLTGHTGFKGSWMSIWLKQMGADLTGFSLEPPTNPSLFVDARVADGQTLGRSGPDGGLFHLKPPLRVSS